MSFLTPWAAVAAAAVAVPLLLLLYFLKLRRQPLRVPSTLLWLGAHEDLEVNAPFQRLRLSLLLVLQALALLLLLLALAQPVLEHDAPGGTRLILLVDASASMSAADAGTVEATGAAATRLDAAKQAATEIVERLARSSRPRQTMVIAFGAAPRIASGFETNRDVLRDVIAGIEPTDEPADLAAALSLAGAFAARGEEADEPPPDVILVSDGGVGAAEDPAGFTLPAGRFRFVRVGSDARNVGVAGFGVRRDVDDPAEALVFARLVNAGGEAVETTATLRVDGAVARTRRVEIPAADDRAPGERVVTFELEAPGGSVIAVDVPARDALAADDTAAAVLPPPSRPRVAVVHGAAEPDPFLVELLRQAEPRELRVLPAEAFAAMSAAAIDAGTELDLIVHDRVPDARLPGVPSLWFGTAPVGIETRPPSREGGQRVLSWDRRDPIMRHVALDTVTYAGFGAFELPATAEPLASGPDGPIIATVRARGARHVLVGFALRRSSWPVHVSFAVFMQNVMEHLTVGIAGHEGLWTRAGEPLSVRAAPDARRLALAGPAAVEIDATPGASVALPPLPRVGLYRVDGAQPPHELVAVNLLSDAESDLRLRDEVTVNAEAATAGDVGEAAALELWPWLVALGLAMLVVEWIVYGVRATS